MNRKRFEFEIYRPPKPTGRLVGDFAADPKSFWMPSISYKYSLEQIQSQMTPAEAYRDKLVNSDKVARMLIRLEWRWEKKLALWTALTLKVQKVWRGTKGRELYRKLLPGLIARRKERLFRVVAVEQFNKGELIESFETLSYISETSNLSTYLWVLKLKILYLWDQGPMIEKEAKTLIDIDPKCADAYYLLVCYYVKNNRLKDAYNELTRLFSRVDRPFEQCFLIKTYVCMKMYPPKHSEAADAMDVLCMEHPENMNYFFQRACANSCLQEFEKALSDLNIVQYYQPGLSNILCMRARVHACLRDWKSAKRDYDNVLYHHPGDPTALAGINDIIQEYDDLPMIDKEMVKNAM